jgi:hypothetical protein
VCRVETLERPTKGARYDVQRQPYFVEPKWSLGDELHEAYEYASARDDGGELPEVEGDAPAGQRPNREALKIFSRYQYSNGSVWKAASNAYGNTTPPTASAASIFKWRSRC